MDSTPPLPSSSWTRPDDLRPRSRRIVPFAIAGIAIGLSLTTGMLIAGDRTATTTMIPIPVVPPAVTITTPQAAAPPVTVTVTTPPPTPIEELPKPAYRALKPELDPSCIAADLDTDLQPVCTWDDGFPAISGDGTTLVSASPPDDGGRGNPGLRITFIDLATQKVVRSILVLDPDDHDPDNPNNDKVRAKTAKRAAEAQKLIDAGDYRSLISLGENTADSISTSTSPDTTGIHAEFSGSSMRLVDPATRTTLWRHRFSAPSPIAKPNHEQDCQGWSLAQVDAWWDPSTRIVIGNLLYHHGGCMCGSSSITQVFRL